MITRATGGDDREQVLALVRDAFGGGDDEVDIVERVWRSDRTLPELDLVAVDGDEVVGHVLNSRADLDGRDVVALAPLAVVTRRQRQGIGGLLVRETIARADEAGFPLIGLLGHWTYYPRFGFEPAMPLGIEPKDPAMLHDPRAFMIRKLASFDDSVRGRFLYPWEIETG